MMAGLDRDALLRRFEALLDSTLDGEPAPNGIDAEILSSVLDGEPGDEAMRCDSYAVWSAITALTQEIKLQGRAFQDLNLALAAQTGKIADELRAVYADRERGLRREAERRSRREVLSALIDLRDRLGRGHESVRARQKTEAARPKAPWWNPFQKPPADPESEALNALIRGYELSIERLDQTLDEFNAREIRCLGEPFDPRTMNAIESVESDSAAPNIVLEVFRSGYEWNGEIFRPAQVKVSRSSSASGSQNT